MYRAAILQCYHRIIIFDFRIFKMQDLPKRQGTPTLFSTSFQRRLIREYPLSNAELRPVSECVGVVSADEIYVYYISREFILELFKTEGDTRLDAEVVPLCCPSQAPSKATLSSGQ